MTVTQLPWEEVDWLEAVTVWIHARLAERGWRAVGPVEVVHRRAWSAFARVPTSGGLVYFKAAAPSVRFEAGLAKALARWRPDCMLPILAVDAERGWLLSPDAGVTLRSVSASPEHFAHWRALLPLYVGVQRESVPRVAELLALGMPDRRLAQRTEQQQEWKQALVRLKARREANRQRGIYAGDLVAEVRSARDEQLGRLWPKSS